MKRLIKSQFKLDFEESEIINCAKRLGSKGIIEYKEADKRFDCPDIRIKNETKIKILNNYKLIEKTEGEVIEKWIADILLRYHNYPIIKQKIDCIVDALHIFISKMIVRHGVESVSVLYPEIKRNEHDFDNVSELILNELPKSDTFVNSIIKLEIPKFFKTDDDKRKKYISVLFNSSFYFHLIQIDEKCSRLLKDEIRGQKLFLDNNILYSLVGLHGEYILRAVHSLLSFATNLGYELWITTKTIDEFHNSLNWKLNELKQSPPIPADLARLAVENLEQDNFLVIYWKEFVKNRLTIDEFISEKSHIESILDGFNIQTSNKYRKDIEESSELSDEMSLLRQVCEEDVNNNVIEHDAFHRILINKIRKGHKYHYRKAVAWFLTHDSKLPKYGRFARKGEMYLPFCITSDQWTQINRPLLARTSNIKEYEESFHALVTQPFLRSMISTTSIERAYNQVLGKLSKYKKMNPKFAFEIITDNHFMISMAQEENEEKQEEKLENKFVDIANEYQNKSEILEQKLAESQNEIETMKLRIKEFELNFSSLDDKIRESSEQIKTL